VSATWPIKSLTLTFLHFLKGSFCYAITVLSCQCPIIGTITDEWFIRFWHQNLLAPLLRRILPIQLPYSSLLSFNSISIVTYIICFSSYFNSECFWHSVWLLRLEIGQSLGAPYTEQDRHRNNTDKYPYPKAGFETTILVLQQSKAAVVCLCLLQLNPYPFSIHDPLVFLYTALPLLIIETRQDAWFT
jgi:hypothetical protein